MRARKTAVLAITVAVAVGGLGGCGGESQPADPNSNRAAINDQVDGAFWFTYESAAPLAVRREAQKLTLACATQAWPPLAAAAAGASAWDGPITPMSAFKDAAAKEVSTATPQGTFLGAVTENYNSCVTSRVYSYDGPGVLVADANPPRDVDQETLDAALTTPVLWLQAHPDMRVARIATRHSDAAKVTISGQKEGTSGGPTSSEDDPPSDAGDVDEAAPESPDAAESSVDPSESAANSNLPGADRECTGTGQREIPPGVTVADGEWPAAYTGWTVTLGTYASRSEAEDVAARAKKRGLSPVGVLDGQVFCPAGGYTAFFGAHPSSEAAETTVDDAAAAGFKGAYAVEVAK